MSTGFGPRGADMISATYEWPGGVALKMHEDTLLTDGETYEVQLRPDEARRISAELLTAARLAEQQ